ncbi:MAG: hypothetical protein LC798_15470 [Chloroflexi bacterium]|nr:hypothetical protein [Chloroflexota bacterium]
MPFGTEDLRREALALPGGREGRQWAVLYVGDQVGRLADAVERLCAGGRIPVDATLRTAPEETVPPAGLSADPEG